MIVFRYLKHVFFSIFLLTCCAVVVSICLSWKSIPQLFTSRYVNKISDKDSSVHVLYRQLYDEVMETTRQKPSRTDCPKEMLLLSNRGRFGNMFQEYMAARAISVMQRQTLYVSLEFQSFFRNYFHGLKAVAIDVRQFQKDCLISDHLWTYVSLNDFHENNYLTPLKGRFTKIVGFPLNITVPVWHLLFKYRDNFLQEFQWKEELIKRVNNHIRNITTGRQYSTLVGIHVRLTDFPDHTKKIDGGFHQADQDYFHRAKQYFKLYYPQPLFLVVSDNIAWCKEHMYDQDVLFAGNNNEKEPGFDLAILKSCDHLILTYGTFTVTAGYFNSGEILIGDDFSEKPDELNERLKQVQPPKWKWIPVITNNSSTKSKEHK